MKNFMVFFGEILGNFTHFFHLLTFKAFKGGSLALALV
jgi:hypothetical protein